MPPSLQRLPLWVWWIPVVWIVSAPVGLTITPQWHRVHLVPFSDPADKAADLAVNVMLFVPFGYSFARRPGGVLALTAAAAATSLSAEALQLFSTVRYPSGTDIAYAVLGALAGASIALALGKIPRRP